MARLIAGLTVAGLTTALLVGCGAPDAQQVVAAEKEPVRIAVMQGATGALAILSADFTLGVNTATEEINAAGGIAGRPLEVSFADTRSDASQAVSVLNEMLDSDNPPDLVVLSGSSAETLASLPALSDAGIFSLGPPSAPSINNPTAYPYHFGTNLTQVDVLQTITDTFDAKKVKTLGVLAGADALGDAQLKGVEQAAKTAGVEIIAIERPDMTDLNFTVEFQRLVASGPDAIFADSHSGDALSRIFEARTTLGATNILFVAGPGAAYVGPSRISGASALENCEMPVGSYTVAPVVDYLGPLAAAMKAKKAAKSAATVGNGYDTIRIAALALKQTNGDSSGEAMAEAMTSIEIPRDYAAGYPRGTKYTEDNHFPERSDGALRMISCGATLSEGFWALD
jgi:branched-chain amino acid transport system substrate-binding protein